MKINHVDERRITRLNNVTTAGEGEVIYLMDREQRLDDNWAFIHALNLAGSLGRRVKVVYVFSENVHGLTLRNLDFMIRGLQEVEARAHEFGVVFNVFTAVSSLDAVKICCKEKRPAIVVCDFNPLRLSLSENRELAKSLNVPVVEVDAHNIVPCRTASEKQEYGAYTIRKKIDAVLTEFLTPFPDLEEFIIQLDYKGVSDKESVDWNVVRSVVNIDDSVKPVDGIIPGYSAGMDQLNNFIEDGLNTYNTDRNDPAISGQSGLSPYLHFGHIAPQAAAFEAAKTIGGLPLKGGFLDEIIVRRELSDNFCLHNPHYDSFEGFPSWAKQSLNLHSTDKREYLYKIFELEAAATHDDLWNAAEVQMKKTGIMHGYMRMYWAKKILEWSPDSSEAMTRAVYLNDKYSLDGKDPNGYAGCAWSIGGLHDRAWGERPVFGKVRYMNYKGCRRKFDTALYIREMMNL